MVEMVAHDGGRLVQEFCDLGVGTAFEDLLEEIGVVAAAGCDELLLDGGALMTAVSLWCLVGRGCGRGGLHRVLQPWLRLLWTSKGKTDIRLDRGGMGFADEATELWLAA